MSWFIGSGYEKDMLSRIPQITNSLCEVCGKIGVHVCNGDSEPVAYADLFLINDGAGGEASHECDG